MALIASCGMVATLTVALPAAADPSQSDSDGSSSGSSSSFSSSEVKPSTAAEAKQAWLDAADKAEAANEELLSTQEEESQAKQVVADANIAVVQANLAASSASSVAVKAAAEYADYREQLARFASASFRGGRLGQLSALLTAESSSDYLDEVSSLDQVAGSTQTLLIAALKAKEAATTTADAASAAQAGSAKAQDKADAALAAAHKATSAVADRKSKLEGQVKDYHELFSTLTEQEREAARAAQQAAWEQQAQAAAEQRAADRAADEAAEQSAGPADADADDSNVEKADKADKAEKKTDKKADKTDESARAKAQVAVASALSKLGNRYVFGAAGPNAFDCSGLTSWAWAQAGVSIPRTSSSQSRLPSVPLDQLQPGDLVTYYSPVHHVAMYIGNGQIIHASTESKPVYITSVYRGGPNPTGHRVNY